MVHRVAALCFVALTFEAYDARADLTDVCLSSYERAQVARKATQLRQAKDELVACSQPGCPRATRADCVPWLAEVERALPSVVLSARDADGREVVDVAVVFDGAPLAPKLDGRAIFVDPGEHVFRFEAPGHPPLEQRAVIREGEKDRPLAVVLPWSVTTPAPLRDGASGGEAEPPRPRSSLHPGPAVYALGGLAVLGLGSFAYFGLTGTSDAKSLRDSCLPHCDTSAVAAANRELLVADVSLGVALVAAGIATYLLFTSGDPTPARAKTMGLAF